ncbi:MAG: hypothetical protein WCV62_03895 [Candidatus Peribacteraceae bacterium]|jgi:hypothetical protein
MTNQAHIGGGKKKGSGGDDDDTKKKKEEEEQSDKAIYGDGNLGDDLTRAGEGHDPIEDEVK